MMRIVYIASEELHVPPVKGGAIETWIYEIAKCLGNRGHDTYCLSFYDPLVEKWQKDGRVNILTYKKGLLAKILLCSWKLSFKNIKSSLFYLPYSFWCAIQAKKIKAEIIHVHTMLHLIPLLRFFNPESKIILHLHNVSAIDCAEKLWNQRLLSKVDLVVACSEYLKDEIIKRCPFLSDKTTVLYNGVDLERFKSSPDDKDGKPALRSKYKVGRDEIVILFMGRLVEYKGAHVLLEAFITLLSDNSAVRLFIVGGLTYSNNKETPYIANLKKIAAPYNGRIIFTGYVDHKNIPDFLRFSDIVVVPSLWEEPFGVVVIEAMSMEKSVVAFKKGGIKEIIVNNQNGIFADDPTAEGLRLALHEVVNNEGMRKQLGQNARISVEKRFSWEKIACDVLSVYSSLM